MNKARLVGKLVQFPLELIQLILLAAFVVLDTNGKELLQDVINCGILCDSALRVERNQVGRRDSLGQLEFLFQTLIQGGLHVLFIQLNDEMDLGVCVVVLVIFDEGRRLFRFDNFLQFVFEILGPTADGKFSDFDLLIAALLDDSAEFVPISAKWSDFTDKATEPGHHGLERLAIQHVFQVPDDILGVIVRDRGTPPGTNTIRAVD